ncbi:MAG: CoA transferase, partial [Chloroflexota bacterium]
GHAEWADDPRFNDQYSRWKNQEELDKLLGAWTKGYTHYEVMEKLQRVGVAAMPALSSEEIFNDPHFNAWGSFTNVSHPVIGSRKVIGAPWKFSESDMKMRTHGPMV